MDISVLCEPLQNVAPVGKTNSKTFTAVDANCADSGSPQYALQYFTSYALAEDWGTRNKHRLKKPVPAYFACEGIVDQHGESFVHGPNGEWKHVHIVD